MSNLNQIEELQRQLKDPDLDNDSRLRIQSILNALTRQRPR